MRIGVDASAWTNWRGFGRFTREIVRALAHEAPEHHFVLFFDRTYHAAEGIPESVQSVVTETSEAQSEAISVDGRRSVADMLRMTRAVAREPLDVFFSPSIDSYFPAFNRAPRVVMIHDVMPETIGETMLPSRASRLRRQVKVRAALAQATIVATGSRFVGEEVRRVLNIDHARMAVIPYGVSEQFRPGPPEDAANRVRVRHQVNGRYLLHVGGFGPNKNILGLLDAFGALVSEPAFDDVALVFVGRRDGDAVYEEAPRIDRRLERPDIKEHVMFVGFQPDEMLVDLYQAATAVLLPSLIEGFGLPAVEAVSCGTPAIVTRNSPLPEVLGAAALTVEPTKVNDIAQAMARALTDQRLRHAAFARAGNFSWRTSAHAALAAFEKAANRPSVISESS